MGENESRGALDALSGIIGLVANHKGWRDRFLRARLWDVWEEVTGPDIARSAWPDRFQGKDTLIVRVSDSIWMQQLSFIKQRILDKLNAGLPGNARLKNMRFELGDVEGLRAFWTRRARQPEGPAKAKSPPPEVIERARALVRDVKDTELARALEGLYITHTISREKNKQA